MQRSLYINLKEFFWNNLNKITNSFTDFKVNHIGNGYIKCFWEISPTDNWRIELSQSCFYAIRLFDISNNRDRYNSTCIMKEIQVSKFQSSISFPIPINKGMYYFEFGYRKRNGEWRRLAYQDLNLGYRIKKIIQSFENDNWFNSEVSIGTLDRSPHQKAYQLSFDSAIGGSEKIIQENDMIN